MASGRKARQKERAENKNPRNVTVMVGNIQKVIPWAEYARDYLPTGIKKEKVVKNGD